MIEEGDANQQKKLLSAADIRQFDPLATPSPKRVSKRRPSFEVTIEPLTNITTLEIPKSVSSFAPTALEQTLFESITIEEGNEFYKIVDGSVLSYNGSIFRRRKKGL